MNHHLLSENSPQVEGNIAWEQTHTFNIGILSEKLEEGREKKEEGREKKEEGRG
jgi:hypothetical protein